jgi:serine/threonine-protein kinase
MIGRTLSHYRIVEKIGAGGMGEVYRARDEHLDRDVAIKVLPPGTLADEKARKRFRKEALALSKLNHPNIATVFDFDTQEGVDFIVMELVEGVTLSEKLKAGPLTEKEAIAIGSQIADALEEAHGRDIVHRDLKPGNIAVTAKGRAKVLDFGLARMLRPISDDATTEAMTEELGLAGTLPYMSPEELKGERADHRSDLYSFGVVLYEMATGKRPFEHTLSTALADAIIHHPPEPPSTHNRKVSPGLEHIIIKALDKDPDRRYQTAPDMRVDLERLSAPASVALPIRKPTRSGRWLWTTAGVVAVMAILFALNVGGFRDRLVGPSSPRINSIAVLPLENLSGDPEQEYFADGMTDELIGQLAQIGTLKVISRTSVMQYKEARKPLPEIARELNVEAVIEGTVRRSEDRVRITAQLIEAATDRHLWAESYERDMQDILVLQSDVAQAIVREIQIAVTPEEKARLARTRPVDPEVYEACLKAQFYLRYFKLEEAKAYIQEATNKDPSYALSYALLAQYYVQRTSVTASAPAVFFPKAREAVTKALELDPTSAEAHLLMASILAYHDWEWSDAERQYRQAIELNPGLMDAHRLYGSFLTVMGRNEEAIAEAKIAKELDPLSLSSNTWLGATFFYTQRYKKGIELLQETSDTDPDYPPAHWHLAHVYVYRGMYEEAAAASQKVSTLLGESDSTGKAMLATSYARSGSRDEALKILDELQELEKQRYVPPMYIAFIYISLGEKDQALQWLEKAYSVRDHYMFSLKMYSRGTLFDNLRDDPRFQDLLRRMKFPD